MEQTTIKKVRISKEELIKALGKVSPYIYIPEDVKPSVWIWSEILDQSGMETRLQPFHEVTDSDMIEIEWEEK